MTERKLWNGWNRKKEVKLFFAVLVLFSGYIWYIEAKIFSDALSYASMEMFYAKVDGIQLYHPDLIQGEGCIPGLLCTLFFTAFLAAVTVHRESFFEHWDVTLRRIPKFRGKYLFSKTLTVLFPAVVYVIYYFLCWQFRWNRYQGQTKDEYCVLEKEEFLQRIPKEPFLETVLYLVLATMALLLLSFTIRNVKKDIPGLVTAILGLSVVIFMFSEIVAVTRIIEITVLSVWIIIVTLFNIRHVYRKW